MRLAFLGTPPAAVPPLRALVEAGHDVAIAVTQPDRKRGRGGDLVPSAVKHAAVELGIPVTSRVDDVLDAEVERGVVVAFGKLIKAHVLEQVPMVNVHFSVLPRWRGAAPVERAILAGDSETGVCLMELDEGLDTGPVYECASVPIGPDETAADLRDRLTALGTDVLVRRLRDGLGDPEPQLGAPTYASKIERDELELHWSEPAAHLHRVVRVGRAWTTFRGKRLGVLRAALVGRGPGPGILDGLVVGAGDGAGLELVEVQPAGRAAVPATAWRNGARPTPRERLGV